MSARIEGIVARLHGLHPRLIDLSLDRLRDLLHADCLTVNGKSLGDNIAGAFVSNDEVIAPRERPVGPEREATRRVVELRGRHAEVEEHAVRGLAAERFGEPRERQSGKSEPGI